MKSLEKASNLTGAQDQEDLGVVENYKNTNQNEIFGDFLTEEKVKEEREKLFQMIEKFKVTTKEDQKERKDQDQEEIDRLKKEIGLMG